MTVSSTAISKSYKPGSAMAPEAIGFQFLDPSDIEVVHVVAATGVSTTLVPGTDYVIAGDSMAGTATVQATSVWPADDVFVVSRATDILQLASIPAQEPLPALALERQLDRQTLALQEQVGELDDLTAHAIRLPEAVPSSLLPAAAGRANSLLGFDVLGAIKMFTASAAAALIAPFLPANLKGDPGGNAMAVGPATSIPTLTIPPGYDLIRTSQYGSARGKGGAFYRRKSAAEAAPAAWGSGIWWHTSADGAIWLLNEREPDAFMFGAVADGARAAFTYTVTGTNDAPAIQALLDYCRTVGKCAARLLSGYYRISSPINMGYGNGPTTDRLIGTSSTTYSGWDGFIGTCLISDFSNAPALVIQGQRIAHVTGIAFYGPLVKWISDNKLGAQVVTGQTVDDTVSASWNDPTLSANQDSRYAPMCAIAIDPYSGVRPATSYPDVSYPSWTGIATQYGKSQSSDITIRDCVFIGYNTAVACQPSDYDGNGDFLRLKKCLFFFNKYGISIGNSQARNVEIDSCDFNTGFIRITNRTHGRQTGTLGGPIKNCSATQYIKLFDLNLAYTGQVTIANDYAEACWQIGDVYGGTSADYPLTFESYNYSMHDAPARRGVPPYLLGTPTVLNGSGSAGIHFGAGYILTDSVVTLMPSGITTDGLFVRSIQRLSTITAPYMRDFHNGLCGGLVLNGVTRPGRKLDTAFTLFDKTTGSVANEVVADTSYNQGRRKYGIPVHLRSFQPYFSTCNDAVAALQVVQTYNASSFSLVGKELTLNLAGPPADETTRCVGGAPGDILLHAATGTVFAVHSLSAGVILATMQNNYRDTGAGPVPIIALNSTDKLFYASNLRRYSPPRALFGTLTSGNNVFASIGDGRGSGTAGEVGDLVTGDKIMFDQYRDAWTGQSNTVTTITYGSPGSLTMSTNATRSGTFRITEFSAAPVANS